MLCRYLDPTLTNKTVLRGRSISSEASIKFIRWHKQRRNCPEHTSGPVKELAPSCYRPRQGTGGRSQTQRGSQGHSWDSQETERPKA